jgi:hypothetical protein
MANGPVLSDTISNGYIILLLRQAFERPRGLVLTALIAMITGRIVFGVAWSG